MSHSSNTSVTDGRLWELERQLFQLRTLFEVAQTLAICRDSESILQQVLAVLCGTYGVERAAGFLRDNEENRWRCLVLRGKDAPAITLTDHLKETGNAALADVRSVLAGFFSLPSAPQHSAMVELRVGNRTAGFFFLGPKLSGESYQAHELEMLATAASFTANALENVRLYEALQEAQKKLRLENISLREAVKSEYASPGGTIIGNSARMQEVQTWLRDFSRSEANGLIYGETGTGKELVARAIHYGSTRADGPFIGINCAAIPESLVESEFFGIEAGVATGVRRHLGFFEQATGGTLFIDEVGDMPPASQAKLLRVIQERRLRRVGGDREIPVDVRLIAATNKDLAAAMRAGRFREDLFYRLAVLELRLPPLRERAEDIPLLASHFVQRFASRMNHEVHGISAEAMQALQSYDWPGNVRELENEIERAIAMTDSRGIIELEHLSERLAAARGAKETTGMVPEGELRAAVESLERTVIQNALARFHGNKSQVARVLGLSRLGLQSKINRLGLRMPRQDDQPPEE